MALSKIDAVNFLTGTIPQGNVANASLGAVTALPGAIATGKVLQVVQTNKQDMTSTSSQSYVDISGMSVNITPTSSSNKVLICFSINVSSNNKDSQLKLLRDSTEIVGTGATNNATAFIRMDNGDTVGEYSTMYLDSPSTTSAITYKLQWLCASVGNSVYLNRRMGDTSFGAISNITAMEISA